MFQFKNILQRTPNLLNRCKRFSNIATKSNSITLPVTNVTTLPSGLRIVSESSPSETAAVGIFIDAGSRYENLENNGVAHFFEHIAFKGTPTLTRHDIEFNIEDMGAHLNAYTSREHTVYFAKIFKSDIYKGLKILSDILQNSLITESSVTREKGVILRENEEVNKLYDEFLLDQLHLITFPQQGLGYTILGSEENIKKMKREDLLNYKNNHYTSDRFIIVGTGAIDHQELVEFCTKEFKNLPPKNNKKDEMAKATFVPGEIRIHYDSMTEAHAVIAFEGTHWTSEYAYPLMLIHSMLGVWDRASATGRNVGSMLAADIEENDAAISFMTFNTFYCDTGLFGIYLAAEPEKINLAIEIIMKNFMRLCDKNSVSVEELERAKTKLKNTLNFQDSHSDILEEIGRQFLVFNRRVPSYEILERIDAITLDDLIETAKKTFNNKKHSMSAVGNIDKNLLSYDEISAFTKI